MSSEDLDDLSKSIGAPGEETPCHQSLREKGHVQTPKRYWEQTLGCTTARPKGYFVNGQAAGACSEVVAAGAAANNLPTRSDNWAP